MRPHKIPTARETKKFRKTETTAALLQRAEDNEFENPQIAVACYKKLVHRKNIAAMVSLGNLYMHLNDTRGYIGDEIDWDFSAFQFKALELFNRAAATGDVRGIRGLIGYYYHFGYEHKDSEMLELHHRAAELGDVQSMGDLGWIYQYGNTAINGYDIEPDLTRAVYWYTRALKFNHRDSIMALGEMYENGTGVEKNLERAFKLYRHAANCDDMLGMYYAANMYRDGEGVEPDADKAKFWFEQVREHIHRFNRSMNFSRSDDEDRSWREGYYELDSADDFYLYKVEGGVDYVFTVNGEWAELSGEIPTVGSGYYEISATRARKIMKKILKGAKQNELTVQRDAE